MTDEYQIRLGAEDLQYLVFRSLFQNLNEYIDEEETRGQTLDDYFNQLTGRSLKKIKLERVHPNNFHLGHRPSLIEAPVDEWPAVAVMTFSSAGDRYEGTDRADANVMTLSIECIVKSDPFKIGADGLVLANGDDPEEQVDRRIKRTAEAIHKTMARHRDMNGEVVPTDRPPSVTWGDVFIRDAQVGKDSEIGRYFWQGVRFQYTYLSDSYFDILDQEIT